MKKTARQDAIGRVYSLHNRMDNWTDMLENGEIIRVYKDITFVLNELRLLELDIERIRK